MCPRVWYGKPERFDANVSDWVSFSLQASLSWGTCGMSWHSVLNLCPVREEFVNSSTPWLWSHLFWNKLSRGKSEFVSVVILHASFNHFSVQRKVVLSVTYSSQNSLDFTLCTVENVVNLWFTAGRFYETWMTISYRRQSWRQWVGKGKQAFHHSASVVPGFHIPRFSLDDKIMGQFYTSEHDFHAQLSCLRRLQIRHTGRATKYPLQFLI